MHGSQSGVGSTRCPAGIRVDDTWQATRGDTSSLEHMPHREPELVWRAGCAVRGQRGFALNTSSRSLGPSPGGTRSPQGEGGPRGCGLTEPAADRTASTAQQIHAKAWRSAERIQAHCLAYACPSSQKQLATSITPHSQSPPWHHVVVRLQLKPVLAHELVLLFGDCKWKYEGARRVRGVEKRRQPRQAWDKLK